LRSILLQAFIELDEEVADRALGEVFQSLGPEVALRDVVFPALVELGAAWQDGRASVAAEHFGSGLIRARLLAALGSCSRTAGQGVALIGAAPNEQHDIPPLVLAILLRRRGWQSVYLGSGMPFEALVDAVTRKRPLLVCLSSSTSSTVPDLVDALMRMRRLLETKSVTLTYGGLPFRQDPTLCEPLAGVATYLGDDLTTAADIACGLLNSLLVTSTPVTG
jgi:methanogenic corrinoid protein MtbC1